MEHGLPEVSTKERVELLMSEARIPFWSDTHECVIHLHLQTDSQSL